MKPKIDLDGMPHNYMMCTNASCDKSVFCLRYLAYECISESTISLNVVNPKMVAGRMMECPYFRSSDKVRYAKGFIGILDALPVKVWKTVTLQLQFLFNVRNYYRVRKGERLLAPSEQRDIINVLRRNGVNGNSTFDSYVDVYEW